MRTKLVQFDNDTYGIRYGWFYHTFQDFVTPNFTWNLGSRHFGDCQVEESVARGFLRSLTRPYIVIE